VKHTWATSWQRVKRVLAHSLRWQGSDVVAVATSYRHTICHLSNLNWATVLHCLNVAEILVGFLVTEVWGCCISKDVLCSSINSLVITIIKFWGSFLIKHQIFLTIESSSSVFVEHWWFLKKLTCVYAAVVIFIEVDTSFTSSLCFLRYWSLGNCNCRRNGLRHRDTTTSDVDQISIMISGHFIVAHSSRYQRISCSINLALCAFGLGLLDRLEFALNVSLVNFQPQLFKFGGKRSILVIRSCLEVFVTIEPDNLRLVVFHHVLLWYSSRSPIFLGQTVLRANSPSAQRLFKVWWLFRGFTSTALVWQILF